MVRLDVLAGTKAGSTADCSGFPISLGRASEDDLKLEDAGVFPAHCSIHRQRNDLILQAAAEALVTVNGEAVQQAALRNGDIIGLGAAKLRFGFMPVRQTSLAWREWLTWLGLAALVLGEVAIASSI
jgi:hypothetical protein